MEKTDRESLLHETLEQQENWDGVPMCLYQGLWCPLFLVQPLLNFQKNFKPENTDIILSSLPKAGTTWLKALLFSIVNRDRFPVNQSPLLTTNPHKLVFSLECDYFNMDNDAPHDNFVNLEKMSHPRVLSTHLPSSLIINYSSRCKIVYVSRNPLDQFVSERQFFLKNRLIPHAEPLPVDQAFDMFLNGVHAFGPFWDHILGYWKASLENPKRILFVKYEDMKRDPISNIIKIAEFVGLPFSDEEEKRGLIQEIANLCSFEKLKNLEINKKGIHYEFVSNSSFFRKGEIGDWKNHLTPAMAERLKQVMDDKMIGLL